MNIKRINVVVSEDAHAVLDEFQRRGGYATRDKALDELLLSYNAMKSGEGGIR